MKSRWAMRGFLIGVLAVIVMRYALANTSPMLDHNEFDLHRRQRTVAITFADRGVRFCCGDDRCKALKSELGVYAPIVLCTTRQRTPQCGVGDGVLIDGKFIDDALNLRDFERLLS